MAPAMFLMGVGPIARWKQASLPELAVRLRWAFGVSVVTALFMPFIVGEWKPLVSFGLLLAFLGIASDRRQLHGIGFAAAARKGCLRNLPRSRAAITACMLRTGHSGVHHRRHTGRRI